MTAIVRIYTHSGLVTAPVAPSGGRFTSDSVAQLKQPYLSKERLTANDSTSVTSSAGPNKSELVLIQVQPGKTVHYEVTTGNIGTPIEADVDSPTMSGDTVMQYGAGWVLSFLESTE